MREVWAWDIKRFNAWRHLRCWQRSFTSTERGSLEGEEARHAASAEPREFASHLLSAVLKWKEEGEEDIFLSAALQRILGNGWSGILGRQLAEDNAKLEVKIWQRRAGRGWRDREWQ